MISHVKFVSIPTTDQDRGVAFWTEKVGFRVLTDQPFDEKQRWIELRVGSSDTRIVLFKFDGQGLQPGGPFNGAFACDNIEQTHRQMVERGVNMTPLQKEPWGTFTSFKDPDGNLFILSNK
jgi:catechol 2,3-dioxygenase-like lactoylglutathione lyase family enzyme